MRAVGWLGAGSLLIVGVVLTVSYPVLVFIADDRAEAVQELAGLAGFGATAFVASVIWIVTLAERNGYPLLDRVRIPWYVLGFIAFAGSISFGIATKLIGTTHVLAPFLATVAACGVAVCLLGFVLRWTPDASVRGDVVAKPTVWGMIGATAIAGVMQGLVVVGIIIAVLAALMITDPELINADLIRSEVADFAENPDGEVPSVFLTPSAIFVMYGLLAVVAPMIEEFAKFLGVLIPFSARSAPEAFNVFVAGIAAGLAFGTAENIGYAMLNPAAWSQVMLLRAPIVLIHMAATSIVALGWYRQSRSGGYPLVWYYLIAIGLHGIWNALFVSFLLVGAHISDTESPGPLSSLVVLGIVAAMGSLLLISVGWIGFNARRLGRMVASPVLASDIGYQTLGELEPGPGIG